MVGVVKTIRVSEECYAWLRAHKRDDETMEETIRRMTRGPNPEDVAGFLTKDEAEEAKEASGTSETEIAAASRPLVRRSSARTPTSDSPSQTRRFSPSEPTIE